MAVASSIGERSLRWRLATICQVRICSGVSRSLSSWTGTSSRPATLDAPRRRPPSSSTNAALVGHGDFSPLTIESGERTPSILIEPASSWSCASFSTVLMLWRGSMSRIRAYVRPSSPILRPGPTLGALGAADSSLGLSFVMSVNPRLPSAAADRPSSAEVAEAPARGRGLDEVAGLVLVGVDLERAWRVLSASAPDAELAVLEAVFEDEQEDAAVAEILGLARAQLAAEGGRRRRHVDGRRDAVADGRAVRGDEDRDLRLTGGDALPVVVRAADLAFLLAGGDRVVVDTPKPEGYGAGHLRPPCR